MSVSASRFVGSIVYATAFVFWAAAATLAAAASTDPAQRFEAAPEVDGKISLPQSLQGPGQTVTVVARLSADPITVVQAKQGRKLTAAEKQQIHSSLQGQQAALTSASTRAGIPNRTSICRIISKASTSVSCLLFPAA